MNCTGLNEMWETIKWTKRHIIGGGGSHLKRREIERGKKAI